MYVCMCVCMSVSMYVYMCICVYVYMYMYACVCVFQIYQHYFKMTSKMPFVYMPAMFTV